MTALPARSERICLSAPDITEAEELALVRALRSGWVAPLGPEVDAFEAELAMTCGREHAVALSSGTAALHLGLLALGVGPGDLVVTSTLTFAATANAVIYTGARPVFVDCDASGNMDPTLLASTLTHPSVRGRVKAIVPVDMLGKVADHSAIGAIAQRHGIPVLSDAAESLGAMRDGRPGGAHGLVAALSFNGNKIMTTSGGGALVTDDAGIAARVRHLATQAREPVVHYEHKEIGYNYRLSNLLAALGRAQLSRLDQMMERRRRNRLRYLEMFADVPGVQVFGEDSGLSDVQTHDNWWLSSVLVREGEAGFSSEDLRLALESQDIECRPMWKPMHLQPVFRGATAFVNGTSQRLFAQGLALPSGSALTDAQIDRVHGVVSHFLQGHRAA